MSCSIFSASTDIFSADVVPEVVLLAVVVQDSSHWRYCISRGSPTLYFAQFMKKQWKQEAFGLLGVPCKSANDPNGNGKVGDLKAEVNRSQVCNAKLDLPYVNLFKWSLKHGTFSHSSVSF